MKIEELKLPEKVYLEKWDIYVKPYLTVSEKAVIVNTCSQITDVVSREKMMDEFILQLCCDIDVKTIQEYDLLKINGVIDDVKQELHYDFFNELECKIAETLEVGNVINIALDLVAEKIPEQDTIKKFLVDVTKELKKLTKKPKAKKAE